MYSQLVQQIVDTLEENILSKWQLEHYAEKIGYSKFYLTRQFKKETGVSIGAYIRKRRLAVAAFLLLHSDDTILIISFECQFQSQEAFSRAFKELYHMPPGKYRNLMRSIHLKEEQEMTKNEVKGWLLTGSNPHLYTIKADHEVFHTGSKSGYLGSALATEEGHFGTMMQVFSAKNWLGKRMKMSCFLKTKDAMKCGAWCRIDTKNGDLVQFDNMDNRSIHGTTDWNYYSIVLDVPEESAAIHFGVLLVGSGEVWIDGITFEEVDRSVPSTNMTGSTSDLPAEPVNLDFDEL
ncbi:MAG: AraC family transcriptional regulator [Solibacillus sp.]